MQVSIHSYTNIKKLILLFSMFILTGRSLSQNNIELLVLKIEQATTDSAKAVAQNNLAWEVKQSKPELGLENILAAIELCSKNNYIKLRSSCHNTAATIYEFIGNLEHAKSHYFQSIADKKRVNDQKGLAVVYSNLSKTYRSEGNLKEGLYFVKKSILISDSLRNYYGLGLAYNNLGTILSNLGKYDESIQAHQKALINRELIHDSIGMAYSYVNISGILSDKGNYKQAIELLYKGLEIIELKKDFVAQVTVQGNLAAQYRKLKNYPNALKHAQIALMLADKHRVETSKDYILLVISEIYAEMGDFTKQLNYLKQAYSLAVDQQHVFHQAEILANMGACYLLTDKPKQAITTLSKALKLAQQNQNSSTTFKILCKLSLAELTVNQLQKAEHHLKLAKQLLPLLNSKEKSLTYYKQLIQLSNKKGDTPTELSAYRTYFNLRDSVFNDNVHADVFEISTRYDVEKKKNKIIELSQQKKINRLEIKKQRLELHQKNFYILIAVIAFIIFSLFAFIFFRQQQKIARQQQAIAVREMQELERNRIAKDLHDDLGSGLSKIRFTTEELVLKKEMTPISLSKIITINQTAYNLVDSMRDLIWLLNPSNITLETLISRMREICHAYFENTNIETTIEIDKQIPVVKLNSEYIRNVTLVLKEIMQNTIKHSSGTQFILQVKISDNLMISTSDNGIGISDTKTSKGNGLTNIRHRINELGGTLTVSNENGTHYKLTLPLTQELISTTHVHKNRNN